MIQTETTWHPKVSKQKTFSWNIADAGVVIDHNQNNGCYVIPWNIFTAIVRRAKVMANANNGIIIAGIHQTQPPSGSLGQWILSQSFYLTTGKLTPRHLAFIGPILGRMGFIEREIQRSSIMWRFD